MVRARRNFRLYNDLLPELIRQENEKKDYFD